MGKVQRNFSIDEETKEFMEAHKEINWSELINEFLKGAKIKIEDRNYNLKELLKL